MRATPGTPPVAAAAFRAAVALFGCAVCCIYILCVCVCRVSTTYFVKSLFRSLKHLGDPIFDIFLRLFRVSFSYDINHYHLTFIYVIPQQCKLLREWAPCASEPTGARSEARSGRLGAPASGALAAGLGARTRTHAGRFGEPLVVHD